VNKNLKKKQEPVILTLDAFIASISSYDDIKTTFENGKCMKEEFERYNVLFQEDNTYIWKIFEKAEVVKNDWNF